MKISSNLPRRPSASVLAALSMLAAAPDLLAQAGADLPANAPLISASLPASISFNNSSAGSTGETYPAGFLFSSRVEATIWYRWTAPSTGLFKLAVASQDFDSILAVFTATSGALPLVDVAGQNNDFGLPTGTFIQSESVVYLSAQSGTTYYLMVGGDETKDPSGSGVLDIRAATAATNDALAAAVSLGVQFPVQAATTINAGATAEPSEPAHGGSAARRSLWWTWQAQKNGPVAVVVRGTNPDAPLVLGVYTGSGSIASLVPVVTSAPVSAAAGSFYSSFNAVSGTTYYLALDVSAGTPDSAAFAQMTLAVAPSLREVLASTGTALPTGPSYVPSALGPPVISDGGAVAFTTTLAASQQAAIKATNDLALLFRPAGSSVMKIIVREGGQTEAGSGDVKNVANPNPFEASGLSCLQYENTLKGTGITGANATQVMIYNSNGEFHSQSLRLGSSLGGSLLLKTLNPPVLAGPTTSAASVKLGGASAPATSDTAFVRGGSILVAQNGTLLREGQAIVGMTQAGFSDIPPVVRMAEGSLGMPAFSLLLRSLAPPRTAPTVTALNDAAVFVGDLAVVFEDQTAPVVPGAGLDSSVKFAAFGHPSVNKSGEVAFVGTLRGGLGPRKVIAATDRGIFTTLGTGAADPALAAVARKGYLAVDQQGRSLPCTFDSFHEPVIITDHHVIFSAKLRGTEVDASNDIGIWAWSPVAGLRCVFREGDTDGSTRGQLASILSFSANSVSTLGAFLTDPRRRDDLFILGSLVAKGTVNTGNNLCLWHISLNSGGDVGLPSLVVRKGEGLSDPAWPRARNVVSIASMPRSGGGDGLPAPVSRLGESVVQAVLMDPVTKKSHTANVLFRTMPYLQVQ